MELNIEMKEKSGTGAARAVRREGKVPGIVYGKGFEPVKVALSEKELVKAIHTHGFRTKLITLKGEKTSYSVLARDVQFHPVTDRPEHIDFQKVDASQEIKVAVPVVFINADKSPGLKRGGVLNVVRHDIEFYCKAGNVPDNITIDLGGTKIGDSIHINSVKLPEGIRAVIARNFTIATVAGATVEVEETPVAAAEAAPVAGAAPAAGAAAAAPAADAAKKAEPAKKEGKK